MTKNEVVSVVEIHGAKNLPQKTRQDFTRAVKLAIQKAGAKSKVILEDFDTAAFVCDDHCDVSFPFVKIYSSDPCEIEALSQELKKVSFFNFEAPSFTVLVKKY